MTFDICFAKKLAILVRLNLDLVCSIQMSSGLNQLGISCKTEIFKTLTSHALLILVKSSNFKSQTKVRLNIVILASRVMSGINI